ncbi:MAG: hypothetical protein ACRDY7_01865, partial [Acidimicrobiia bacterium]
MSEARPKLPEPLLAPLLDVAAEVLRSWNQAALPGWARRLGGFDRRGLSTPTARAQLLRLVTEDEAFAGSVIERFAARPEVAANSAEWDPAGAAEAVVKALDDGTLPTLASVLWALRPAGAEFALGLAVAAFVFDRSEDERAGELRALERRLAAATEAQRRAEKARDEAAGRAERFAEERRAERQERRDRRSRDSAEVSAARQAAAEAAQALADARHRAAEAEARAAREAARARVAEERERSLRADLAAERESRSAT